MDFISFEISAA